jgi:hypothetical protein
MSWPCVFCRFSAEFFSLVVVRQRIGGRTTRTDVHKATISSINYLRETTYVKSQLDGAGTFSNAVYRAVYAGRQLAQVSGGRLLGRKSRFRKDLWERRTLGAEAETVHSIPAAVRKSREASRDGLYKHYRHITLWNNAFWAGKTVGAIRK